MANKKLKEGDKAPDFSLFGADGREHSLSEYKGKYLILYFYPKDNTPGCTIEAKEFTDHAEEIRGLGAEIVGISKDSIDSHQKFASKQKLAIQLLSDPDSKVIKAYGAYGDRGIFGMGTLRQTFIISPEGKIAKIFEKVKPNGHANEVIEALKELKNKK